MKKIMPWLLAAAVVGFALDWAVMGLKLLDGNYDLVREAYLALVCLVLLLVCAVYKLWSGRCPHCGKVRLTEGAYCPYCGRKLK